MSKRISKVSRLFPCSRRVYCINSASSILRSGTILSYFLISIFVFSLLSGCTLLPANRDVQPTLSDKSTVDKSAQIKQFGGRSGFKQTDPRIKSVILLIGDGMGFEHLNAASLYAHGEEGQLFMQTAPYQHVVSTGNVEDRVTDSAASATAMATGQRVENRVLSVGADGQPLETSLEFFQRRCKSTGIVVTAYLNHATPAAFAAHQPDRAMLSEIAADIYTQTKPNVLLGGTAEGITVAMAENAGYTVVRDRTELLDVSNNVGYLSGQFSHGNMAYEYEHAVGLKPYYEWQPHLSEMTAKALTILDQDPDGFFLMVEGSRIDHASHANALPHTIFEVLEFDKTVQAVVEWAAGRSDVLVIVTADHETGGLYGLSGQGVGEFPSASWSTGEHSSSQVPIYGWNVDHAEANSTVNSTFAYRLATDGFASPPTECENRTYVNPAASGGGANKQVQLGSHHVLLPLIHSGAD